MPPDPGPPQKFVPPALNVRAYGASPPAGPLTPVFANATENFDSSKFLGLGC